MASADAAPAPDPNTGLCGACLHVRRVANRRGSVFYMCGKAAEDSRLPRYPRLPVHACLGYAPDIPGKNPPQNKK